MNSSNGYEHEPCSCREGKEPSRLVLGRMLVNLGHVLSDVGRLLMDEVEEGVASDPLLGHELPDGYKLCSCTKDCCDRDTDKNGHYFCKETKNNCSKTGDLCDCHLFRYEKSKEKSPWEHRADPGESDPDPPDNATYFYKCLCVSTKK